MPTVKRFDERMKCTPDRDMALDGSRLLLSVNSPFSEKKPRWRQEALDTLPRLLRGTGLVLEKDPPPPGHKRPQQIVNHTGQYFWVRTRDGSRVKRTTLQALSAKPWLDWYAPIYRLREGNQQGGLVCPLPDLVAVPMRTARESLGLPHQEITHRLSDLFDLDAVSDEQDEYDGPPIDPTRPRLSRDYRPYRARKPRERTAYQTLQQLRELEPAWGHDTSLVLIPMLKPTVQVPFPDDPEYVNGNQWNVTRIGADVAWTTTQGKPGIVIAVIDEGCDFGHDEFARDDKRGNIVPGDALLKGATFYADGSRVAGEYGNCAHVPSQTHGTKCTGIIAAWINNQQAIAGLAPDCKILPIRLDGGMTSISLSRAIRFAVHCQAHVINISLADPAYSTDDVAESLQFAYDSSVVVCCAAGNDNFHRLDYPAAFAAANDWVIACGACDNNDQRCASFTSWDAAKGSNYGTGLSVVAPGNSIPTIVNSSSGRTNRSVTTFAGTSAATPHVSAVVALMLSERPELSPKDVRDIIERSAEPINDNNQNRDQTKHYYYDFALSRHRAKGKGWNNEVGYGLLRADLALKELRGMGP